MRTLVVLLAGQAMAVMDGSILAVAAPSLSAQLHATGAELQLIVAMYTIAFATLVVTGARLGDLLGRWRVFELGLGGFTLASLAGGLAPTPAVLIIARACQGAAAALMTPQVLSIIQLRFQGEVRARAIGAYSLILAVGVAAGQVLGGLLVGAHLLVDAWRPALLLNAPAGAILLLATWRGLPRETGEAHPRLDLAGVALLSAALLALIVPLTFGRDAGWPGWVWPCLIACPATIWAFVTHERRLQVRGRAPLLHLDVLGLPGVAAGVTAVMLIMGSYAGFLLSLTLHLQRGLGFTPFAAGLIFAVYAAGFATASLLWTCIGTPIQERLPVLGPLMMAGALLGVGLLAGHGGWPTAATAPLLFAGGVGHACGFSPLTNRLTRAIEPARAADLSGLVLTASLVGNVMGVAALVGVYLGVLSRGSASALTVTTVVLGGALVTTAACALRAVTVMRKAAQLHSQSERSQPVRY
jgi:MFS family permease